MKLYQILRQVVPGRTVTHDDDTSTTIPGLTQVVWEGTSSHQASVQLDMVRSSLCIESPKGTIYLIHETKS